MEIFHLRPAFAWRWLARGKRANNFGVFLDAVCFFRRWLLDNPTDRRTNRFLPSRRTGPAQAIVGPFYLHEQIRTSTVIPKPNVNSKNIRKTFPPPFATKQSQPNHHLLLSWSLSTLYTALTSRVWSFPARPLILPLRAINPR